MEEDVFREAMKQLRSNCPWEEKYTFEQLQRSVTSTIGTGGSSKTYTAQYRLEFESRTYSLSVQYMEKGEERGFMSFQINLQSLQAPATPCNPFLWLSQSRDNREYS